MPKPPVIPPEVARRVALDAARGQGCNCDPIVRTPNRVERRKLERIGLEWAQNMVVEHDDWCSHPSQVARRVN